MNLVLLVGVLFAGFLANKESIPLPLRWITYLSVFRCVGCGGGAANPRLILTALPPRMRVQRLLCRDTLFLNQPPPTCNRRRHQPPKSNPTRRYAWEAMVINELRSLYLYFTAPNVSITVSMKGTVFLDIIGVKDAMLLPDIAVLVAMYVGCCIFLCFVMFWRYGRRHG